MGVWEMLAGQGQGRRGGNLSWAWQGMGSFPVQPGAGVGLWGKMVSAGNADARHFLLIPCLS